MKANLRITNVSCSFGGLRVLDNASLSMSSGQVVSLSGVNGSGKSTLLNIVSGYVKADSGGLRFRDRDLVGLSPVQIAKLGIGRTWQTPRVFDNLSALENLLVSAADPIGERWVNVLFRPTVVRSSEERLRERALQLLSDVALGNRVASMAGELSFGQRKLLNIAMLRMNDAELLVMDEPFAGLAPEMVDHIAEVIMGLRAKGHGILLVDHNEEVVSKVSDARYRLQDGRLILIAA